MWAAPPPWPELHAEEQPNLRMAPSGSSGPLGSAPELLLHPLFPLALAQIQLRPDPLDLALQIASGVAGLEQPKLILGGRIAIEGTAVVITAEDSFDAVHRRLNRIDPTARRLRHPRRLIVLPLPDAATAARQTIQSFRKWVGGGSG